METNPRMEVAFTKREDRGTYFCFSNAGPGFVLKKRKKQKKKKNNQKLTSSVSKYIYISSVVKYIQVEGHIGDIILEDIYIHIKSIYRGKKAN